jgi:hypothetical protein
MAEHALLSASAANRWLNCTAAPRFEEQFPETTSEYAEEGRLAHSICELKALKKFTTSIKPREFTAKLNKLKKDPLYADEMDKTADAYLEHLTAMAMAYDSAPLVNAEVRVELTDYIPEGFGTCDCVMIGGDTLNIVDYKHGKGVPVSAVDNPQIRLYALGALKKYEPFYGGLIKKVCMTIVQPRITDEPSSETLTVEELLAWGETVKPVAQKAFSGFGEFVPGEHCRFCRGKAKCRARADVHTALEEFKGLTPPLYAKNEPGEKLLTHNEIGDLLIRGKSIVQWYKDLEDYALMALLKGEDIAGWKAVAGRSNRAFSDQDAALAAVIAAGYDESLVYERKAKTLTELEKLMGKAAFAENIGAFITKPPGKPTLALLSDNREPYNSAASDFAGVPPGE